MTFNRLLLTGAAGALGRALRPRAAAWTKTLRLSDIADCGSAAAHEEITRGDLGNARFVDAMVAGCDAIIHMGGISVDGPWAPILNANIAGLHNLYEAARRHGTKRIIFASSNHAIGYNLRSKRIDATDPPRADGNYGISKVFGETLSRYYWDRFGIETVCLRIGSAFPEPLDRRMLLTFLSYEDLIELVRCALTAPKAEHTIVFGASDNPGMDWWDNRHAAHLGWQPRESSAAWRAKIEAAFPPEDPARPMSRYQGGKYVELGPYEY